MKLTPHSGTIPAVSGICNKAALVAGTSGLGKLLEYFV